MQNLLRSFSLVFFLFSVSVRIEQVAAQCPGADQCEDAYVFCSLNDMDGFTCDSEGNTPALCYRNCVPCCPPGPGRHWWAFVSQGGNFSITLSVGACYCNAPCNTGIWYVNFGILEDCNCNKILTCNPASVYPGQSQTQTAFLEPCKKYYLIVDNYSWGQWCDFTISTSGGGGPPTLTPLSPINNVANGIIEPVCEGYCDYRFFVNQVIGSCPDPKVNYEWTLDGIEVDGNGNEIHLDFPDQGDFELCVTAYLGNPQNGSICAQEGPKCTIVKVRPLPDRIGSQRVLCNTEVFPNPYPWHTQLIDASGTYRETFTLSNCCNYDSVVDFLVLPRPEVQDVYFISCDNMPFIDMLGRSYSLCKDRSYIVFPKSTVPFRCDSTIRLTSVGVYDSLNWQGRCIGGKVELSPNFSILKKCNIGETYKFDYKWYKKKDSIKVTISTDERLVVDGVNEDYCLDVNIKVYLGTDSAICIKTYCDSINEAESAGSIENIILRYCDSAIFNGQTYHQTTTLKQLLKNTEGCDSIINTVIDIQNSSTTDLKLTACDSLNVNGQVYKQSGDYKQFLQSINSCDSLVNINVTIVNSKFSSLFLSQCDSAIINNIIYKQSGNYQQVLKTVQGCDSILYIDLNIPGSSQKDIVLKACDSIEISGRIYKQSGHYLQKLFSSDGCDSILNLDLIINSSSQTEISQTDCDSVVFNGKTYKQSGDYPERYISSNGCDSVIVLHVNIPGSNTSPLVLSRCDSVTINGKYYTQSGNYTQKLISANGCDSLLKIDLTISKSNSESITLRACDSAIIDGQTYYKSGNYTQILKNADNCDSTLNIDLQLSKSNSAGIKLSDCDPAIINGQTYSQSGIYNQILVNAEQCDSILTIDFTRLNVSSHDLSFKSCDSVIVNKQVYKQSGNYTQILTNSNNCDSVLSLNVEIRKSGEAGIGMEACDSIVINGQTYFQSGKYIQLLTTVDQCDSILNISLNVHQSKSTNYPLSSCDSAIINGQIYKVSGNYVQTLKTKDQCDSTVYIKLNLLRQTEDILTVNACDSSVINGIKYLTSGSYEQKLINTDGCDSTLKIELTIKPGNNLILEAGKDTSICEGEVVKLNGVVSQGVDLQWSTNSGSFDNANMISTNYYPNSVGDKRIYLQAIADCGQLLDSLTVHVLPNQFVRVTGDTILDPCKPELKFTATGGTNYVWTPASFIDCLDPPCSKVKLRSTVATRFTITTDGPCAFPADLNLSLKQIESELYLPNAFSPNGDNINDIFLPLFNCDQITFYNLQIFDRWGNLIFESTNKDIGWNGKQDEVHMMPGVYPYVVEYELYDSGKKVKGGEVTLVK
jgi:gliding motility-associated-like protein